MTKTRRSPIRHKVKSHKREGKLVKSYQRGRGTRPPKRPRRVVGKGSTECLRCFSWFRQLEKYAHPSFKISYRTYPDRCVYDIENTYRKGPRHLTSGSLVIEPLDMEGDIPVFAPGPTAERITRCGGEVQNIHQHKAKWPRHDLFHVHFVGEREILLCILREVLKEP